MFVAAALKLSKFHQTLLQEFEPLVDKYLTGLNENIRTDLEQFLQYETWLPVKWGIIELLLLV